MVEKSLHMNAREAAVKSMEDLATHFQVNLKAGLDHIESERRLKLIGTNELKHPDPEPLYVKYLEQFKEPMILLLLVSALVSCLMGQYDDTVSITVAVLIVVTVAFIQGYRSEKVLEALKKLMPPKCNCLRSGQMQTFLASYLVPGDVIQLTVGDRIPADVRLFDSIELRIDESSLTGETEAVAKNSQILSAYLSHSNAIYAADNNSTKHNYVAISNDDYVSVKFPTNNLAVDRLRGCHDLTNIGFMGTLICCGSAKGLVIATGVHSEFGEVFRMMHSEEAPRTPLQKSMDKLGKQLSIISFIIIAVIVIAGLLQGRPFLKLLNIGVSLAVAAIPEGLPIVVTVTLAIGQMRMAARNAVVKRLPAVETLGCVNVICSDKTGTMTMNAMSVSHMVTASLNHYSISGDLLTTSSSSPSKSSATASFAYSNLSYVPSSNELPFNQIELCKSANQQYPHELQQLLQIGCICNNAFIRDDRVVGQPTEGAIIHLANEMNIANHKNAYTRLQEWPFNSDSKMMMVKCIENVGQNSALSSNHENTFIYFAKGSVDTILKKCLHHVVRCNSIQQLNLVNGVQSASNGSTAGSEVQLLDSSKRTQILDIASKMGKMGLRVLAFAKGTDSNELVFYGLMGLMDPPRPGVDHCVRTLLDSGVRVIMITGDSQETACAIGSRLSIYQPGDLCLSGEEVEQLSVDQLKPLVQQATIFYRSGPRHKCKIVKALQQCNLIVAMTGDGVNDAIALKSSDIGVAMGRSGTDVCQEASDIILLDDNFSTILAAMEEGKSLYHNIKNFVAFQLSTSIAALSLIALSTLLSLPTPLNAMQILFINILMDGPPAQSLGVEPSDDHVVRQPPRRTNESILDRRLMLNVFLAAINIVLGTLWIFHRGLKGSESITPRDTTMTFTCFVLFDMFNALSFRSQEKSVFSIGFFKNRMFVLSVGLSLFGQLMVIYVPPLQSIFQTEALYLTDFFFIICISSTVFIFSELRKFLCSSFVINFFKNKHFGADKFKFKKYKNKSNVQHIQCRV